MSVIYTPETFNPGVPAVYEGMPNEIYHGEGTAINHSLLKAFAESPAELDLYVNGDRKFNIAFEIGTALHNELDQAHVLRRVGV